jgi:hypothetical protein
MPRRIFKPRFARLKPNERAIDRRSNVGNPFRVGDPGIPDRETATALYRKALLAGKLCNVALYLRKRYAIFAEVVRKVPTKT